MWKKHGVCIYVHVSLKLSVYYGFGLLFCIILWLWFSGGTLHHFRLLPFTSFYFSFDMLFLFVQFLPLYVQTFIEISSFYHQQWAPNYPKSVQLRYNGATYQIQLQQHRGRFFLADGLTDFRADLKIYESIIINFFACDDNTIFYLHFTPPLNQQTCGRPILHSRQHIWTT